MRDTEERVCFPDMGLSYVLPRGPRYNTRVTKKLEDWSSRRGAVVNESD